MIVNALTIDVEDYFQVHALSHRIKYDDWEHFPSHVEKNTHLILDILDSQQSAVRNQRSEVSGQQSEVNFNEPNKPLPRLPCRSGRSYWGEIHASESEADLTRASDSLRHRRTEVSQFLPETEKKEKSSKSSKSCLKRMTKPSKSCLPRRSGRSYRGLSCQTKATFFILGWIAKRYPHLVKEIHSRGHEIASHGYAHKVIYNQTPGEFREDIKTSKQILEDLTGQEVIGYRAPTYSITKKTLWALNILAEEGYKYDSSIFPIRHDYYGMPSAPRFPFIWNLNGDKPLAREIHVNDSKVYHVKSKSYFTGADFNRPKIEQFRIPHSAFRIPESSWSFQ